MKETGLMFKAPLVLAILAGQKTQTRRVVKGVGHDSCLFVRKPSKTKTGLATHVMDAAKLGLCPIGKPGDRIYVRETFNHFERNEDFKEGCECFYRADGDCVDLQPWRPAIHMPKHAARIWLEITGVRVERLQGISPDDCIAEGAWPTDQRELGRGHEAIGAFRELWDSTTGRPALPANTNSKRYARVKHWLDTHPDTTGWAANPWVWVIDFKTISTTGRPA